jgi:hypothetical protein
MLAEVIGRVNFQTHVYACKLVHIAAGAQSSTLQLVHSRSTLQLMHTTSATIDVLLESTAAMSTAYRSSCIR